MSIAVYFNPSNLTADLYDQSIAKLEASGNAAPAGRQYHAAFGPPDHLMVFDLWDSAEQFEAFGAALMPIVEQLGIAIGEPDIMSAHNIITG